ncbi:MAG: non-homologous end-joining DNA ligase [Dehalococcoidia bacterium]
MAPEISIGRYTIQLSNTDKVLFPGDGITKGDLIDYYHKIAGTMLPYLEGRPVTMHRFPDGIGEEGFYQQEISDYFPDWVERIAVKKQDGSVTHAICQNAATLVYLANQACITPHVWLSRKAKLDCPDVMIFDLDPPAEDFAPVRDAARSLRGFLKELGLESFVKTTGSRGLHVVVPLDRNADFDEVRDFAHGVAAALADRESEALTVEQRKDKRKGRVFVDYLRNSYGQTAVAPYAVRARAGAPIATPIDWHELGDKNITSQSFNIENIFRRLSRKEDPWQRTWHRSHSVSEARQKLDDMAKAAGKPDGENM